MTVRSDYALTTTDKGTLLAHRADCPMARKAAADGEPVLTMIGCLQPLPDNLERHTCLTMN